MISNVLGGREESGFRMHNGSRHTSHSPRFGGPILARLVGLVVVIAAFLFLVRNEEPSEAPILQSSPTNDPAAVPRRPRATPDHPIPTQPVNETKDAKEDRVELLVRDELTGKPLPGVEALGESSGASAVHPVLGVADDKGRLRLSPDVLSQDSKTLDVRLPAAMGRARLHGKLITVEHGVELTVPAYARIVATLQRGDGSDAVERPKKGKLWVATWPTPEQALGIENLSAQDAALRDHFEGRLIASDTLGRSINVTYHRLLAERPGVDRSQLQVVAADFVPGRDMVVDLPYTGEVVADLYVPGFGTLKKTAQLQRGFVTSIEFDPVKRRTLLVEVTDPEGRPIPAAAVSVVVRREVLPGELNPAQTFCVLRPSGSENSFAYQRYYPRTNPAGVARVDLSFLGTIFASATKEGFVSAGKTLWDDRSKMPGRPLRLSLKRAPPGVSKVTIRLGDLPLRNTELMLADLEPVAQFFEVYFGTTKTDDEGRADFGCLEPGHRYGLSMANRARMITYRPGMIIDMEQTPGSTTVTPGKK